MTPFNFGPLQSYIDDDEITDVNYNGITLWIDHLQKGRYEISLTEKVSMVQLCYQLANYVNQSFNPVHPLVEAEIEDVRVSIIHDSVAKSGHSLSLRKTPKIQRLQYSKMLLEQYADKQILDFLEKSIKKHCHIIVCGLPGAGKTELLKYMMASISKEERVITIEDTLELHYATIHPNKDGVSLKVNQWFNYVDAIKASLRQRPDWMMISEVRSHEIAYFLESASTGTHILSTIHAHSAKAIPKRMMHMFAQESLSDEVILRNIYELIDVGVRVEACYTKDGIKRSITEIVVFDVIEDRVNCETIYEKGNKKFQMLKAGKVYSKLMDEKK